MKLQYLGDYRDAFKWDLLHWLCTRSNPAFKSLRFVPLLTPDDAEPTDGQIHHTRFSARNEVHGFVEDLRKTADGLSTVQTLGQIEEGRQFTVAVYRPTVHVPDGSDRREYWSAFDLKACGETIVFLDPDNGFETKTLRGSKWVLHTEIKWLLDSLPHSSAVVVYQHWPHRAWAAVFAALGERLSSYVAYAAAVHDATLAFVLLARVPATFERISSAARTYAEGHPKVKYTAFLGST